MSLKSNENFCRKKHPMFSLGLRMFKSNPKNPLNFSTKSKRPFAGSCRQHGGLLLRGWEQAARGGCCWAAKGNELLTAPASRTSTSLPPLTAQRWGVKGRAPSTVIFPFSLGAWQPLLLDSNAFSFQLGHSNILNMRRGSIYKPVTQS